MPPVVEVAVGGTARIECNFYIPENASYTYIDWFYVDHSNKQVRLYHITADGVLEDDTDYKKRLSLGEDKALSISEVTLQDPKTFMCQVGAGSYGVGETSTNLSVYKVPMTPEIEPNSGGISVHSSEIPEIAKCVSKNGFPAPNITWHKNGEQLHARENHPSENLKLKVMPSSTLVKEGDNVTLVCEADGNPQPVFTFFKKNLDGWQDVTSLAEPESGVLRLHDVNKTNNGTYRCQSLDLDDMSQIEEDVDLVVNYIEGVHVKMEPSSTLREGDSVTLSCDAYSPVGLKYQWRDDKGKKVGEGNQLLVKNLTFEKSNTFSCKVMAPSVPGLEQSKKVSVAVEGKPRIVAISSPLYVRQGEVINLTCKAIAFPPPTVQWSINGTAHEYVDNQHIASNLTVRVSHDLVQAGAMCRVFNKLGTSEERIQLVADQKSTAESQGVIIVAIIVAILVVAVLGAVIYFLHKKGKIPCGRAGKQDITKPEARKDKIVVEVKSDKLSEEAGLLQGANGEKRAAADQSEKYIDLRN
ncbi:cell surface glycoprotein MUC18 [Geospiza fortis]|uniref:Cell surface glycoprotein MUC18 n=1 Tax=Geospiza fortis TaxID=48883 RepID=A0A8N5F114_GEOFO|nr:cell surface glycoprotein MUC18 [Geospiza fortis]